MRNYGIYTDSELTDLLHQGDHAAFTEIYNRYWKDLLLIAWNHSNDRSLAKDIVNNLFVDLWDRRGTVEIREILPFLITAVKFSVFKNFRRESRRTELFETNYEFSELTDDIEKLDARFLQEYINGIVEQMPERCKLVFRYSREHGLKNAEIADRINISEKGVEATLTRALKIIRGGLKNYCLVIFYLFHYLR